MEADSRQRGRLASWTVAALCGPLVAATAAAAGPQAAAGRDTRVLIEEARAAENGEGVPKDPLRAAGLYCTAATLGDPEAMYALGWMYANGRGVEHNDAYAGTLFAMAAYAGHAYAQRMLRYTGDYTGEVPPCLRASGGTRLAGGGGSVERIIGALDGQRQANARLIAELAPRFGIDPRLALAIALTESNLNPVARSNKNAMGIMQLIPETAERFNVRRPFDPEDNIRGGLAYLRWLLAYFQGDVALAAAGYNAGEGAVDRYRGVPPFRETQGYVDRVLDFVRQRVHPYDSSVTAPSPMLTTLRLKLRSGRP